MSDAEHVYTSDNPAENSEIDHNCFGEDDEDDQFRNDSNLAEQEVTGEEEEDEEEEDEEDEEEEDDEGDEECDVPRDRQKTIMQLFQQSNGQLEEGQKWYLIDIGWLRRWKQYVKFDWSSTGDATHPGPINNERLLEPDTDKVPRSLLEHTHFAIISEKEWQHLHSWYGGGPEIARTVIKTSQYNKSVEIRPLELLFIKSSAPEEVVKHDFSKVTTIGQMKATMCPILELDPENVRIWDYHNKRRSQILEDPEKTLSSCTIIHNQYLLFEEKDEEGNWPPVSRPQTTSYYNYSSSWNSNSGIGSSYSYHNQGKKPTDPGLCGLTNLGNTCFMNSSLQCLSNSPILTHYCISNRYKQEINKDNVLGTGGKLVEEYASLLKDMWSGEYQYIAPRTFKQKLQTFAPQFEGMQQHDSQELLAYLLDGLHEDLNRVRVKPYIELKEADGRPDDIVAEEAWENHLARNNSVIVDWYHGQLKSKLTCPDCDRVSVTFDPCMYLSLPLPMEKNRNIKVTFVPKDPLALPVEYMLTVPKIGSIIDLKKSLSELAGVPIENMVVAELWHHKMYKVYTDKNSVDSIQDNDVIRVYYVDSPQVLVEKEEEESEDENDGLRPSFRYYSKPHIQPTNPDDIIHVQVILQKKDQNRSYYSSMPSFVAFGEPFVIAVRRGITYEDLHELVASKIQRFVKDPSVLQLPALPSVTTTVNTTEETDDMDTAMDCNDDSSKDAEFTETINNQDSISNTDNQTVGEEDEEEDAEDEEEDEEMDCSKEENFCFTLQIADSRGSKSIRNINRGSTIDFRQNEIIAVLFSPELVEDYQVEEESKTEKHDTMLVDDEEEEGDGSIDISECLNLYTSEEQLGPDDLWYCNKCKDHKQATKKFDLWKLPPLLVIHLKRFSYGNRYRREKLDTVVKFPLTGLDLTEHLLCKDMESEPIYDLVAVSNHFGALGGGHYTAYAKNVNDDKWYKYDDSNVSQTTDTSKICSSAAYVLFYQRRDTDFEGKQKYEAPTATTTTEEDDEEEEEEDENERVENEEEEEDELTQPEVPPLEDVDQETAKEDEDESEDESEDETPRRDREY